ncbi:MAG: glycosyltransferase, partial [Solirubrobacterales bacterium]|nr:glycosyltransferase [Solirubrobacterales bacterium]
MRRGSERFIHDLGLGLSRLGHRPGLITSHPGARQVSLEEGLEVIRNFRPRGARAQVGLRGVYLTHLPASRRALRDRDPAIGHALYPTDGLVVNRWARGGGGPAVFSVMGLPDSAALRARPLWRAIIGRALRGADAAVALSARAAGRIDDLFGVECRVIYPGVDLDSFRRSAERTPAPTIFCPADVHDPRKRVGLLVSAFELLRAEYPEATLVLSRPQPGAPPFDTAQTRGV